MRRTPISVLLFLLATFGCDDGVGPGRATPAATIDVVAPAYDLIPGDSIRLSATALTADDETVPPSRIRWTAADPSIATVDSTGLVNARSPGTTDITVQADEAIASTLLRVVEPSASCTSTGTVHLGTVVTPETWERQTGPHHVPDSLDVRAIVTVEPGTTICMGESAAFHIEGPAGGEAGLVARGTAQDSIVMTARTADGRWEGVVTALSPLGTQSVTVSHVRIEHARYGIIANGAAAAIDSSLIRDIENAGVGFGLATGRVLDTVIESAGTGVSLNYANGVTISGTVIHAAAGAGISASHSSLNLRAVRIEGAGATGIAFGRESSGSQLLEASDVTVTGGGGHPASVDARAASILTDPALDNSLTGNASDTIVVDRYAGVDGEIVVRAGLTWHAPSGLAVDGTGVLRLEPGATLVVNSGPFGLALRTAVSLQARGTVANPVTLVATGTAPVLRRAVLGGSPDRPSEIAHTNVDGMILVTGESHTLRVDSSRVIGGGIVLLSTGSRVLGTTIDNANDSAAIVLGAAGTSIDDSVVRDALGNGIHVFAPNVSITRCAVFRSAGDGVFVRAATAVIINQCDFVQNAAAGVRNTDSIPVDARFNWWGDPAGPLGPSGDGVDGDVTFLPFRTTPTASDGGPGRARARARATSGSVAGPGIPRKHDAVAALRQGGQGRAKDSAGTAQRADWARRGPAVQSVPTRQVPARPGPP